MKIEHKIYWLATYGNMGLQVEFFNSERKYKRACKEADEDHASGGIDSYTCSDETILISLTAKMRGA